MNSGGALKFGGRLQGNNEWLTPPDFIAALGHFDLDPCSPVDRPWNTATNHFSLRENGLVKPWYGRVWLNPPFGHEIPAWMRHMSEHGNGIALCMARTETAWFQEYIFNSPNMSALLFLRKRLTFYNANGRLALSNCGGAPVLVAYGECNAAALVRSSFKGFYIRRGAGLCW